MELRPNSADSYDTLGWALRARGQRQEAIESLKKASALDPPNGEIWYHLGVLYTEAGNRQQAVQAMTQALRVQNDFPEAADARRRLQALKR